METRSNDRTFACSELGTEEFLGTRLITGRTMDYGGLPPLRHIQVGVQIGGGRKLRRNIEKRKQKANATSIAKRKRTRVGMGMSTVYTKGPKES